MARKRNRIYVEITNICNRSCSFCPTLQRQKEMMSLCFFEEILPQLQHHATQLFFHVMGEPLLHPQLGAFIESASRYNLPVNITTNGTLLQGENAHHLFHKNVRQINISLHALQPTEKDLLDDILKFANDVVAKTPDKYVNLRLWNQGVNIDNSWIMSTLESIYHLEIPLDTLRPFPLKDRIILHFENRFEWPIHAQNTQSEKGYCLGLIEQLAVLVDGTVVPCCLDSEGKLALGNLHTQSLTQIIQGARAQKIIRGFHQQQAVEPLCKQCTYRERFTRE